MIYIYYSKEKPWIGWMVKNTKWKYSDYCGDSLIFAIRTYFWYLGVPPKIAFGLFKKTKHNDSRSRKSNKKSS